MFLEYRIKESIDIIKKMLELCKNPYIALSFGKDSLVMLDLIYNIDNKIKCIFLKSEESYLMYNFEEVLDYYKEKWDLNLHIVDTKRLSENEMNWDKARKSSNQDFYLDDFFGYDGVFMGLRIEESKGRRLTLIKKENNSIYKFIMQYNTGKRKGMYRCCPMAKWKKEEILFYLKSKNLKMLDVYEEGSHIRTTARLTGDSIRNNTLFWIRKNKPENWKKIIKLLPELKNIGDV